MNPLTDAEIAALREALDDEYRAWTTYDQVVHDFGAIRPFVNIRDAEGRHIAALQRLFARHGLPVPKNPWPGRVRRYASVAEACEAGVAAEIENAELYARLRRSTSRRDLTMVFERLADASQQRHLPAFRRCAARRGEVARGCGHGRRD